MVIGIFSGISLLRISNDRFGFIEIILATISYGEGGFLFMRVSTHLHIKYYRREIPYALFKSDDAAGHLIFLLGMYLCAQYVLLSSKRKCDSAIKFICLIY